MLKLLSTKITLGMKHILLVSIIMAVIGQSCHRSSLEEALGKAGPNRPELEKVLKHYQSDKEKLRAAQFLIENMDSHFSLSHKFYDEFYSDIDSLYRTYRNKDMNFYKRAYDSLTLKYHHFMFECERKNDIQSISADYLIAHIDNAFQMKESPWVSTSSFEHFCNYVLPYRVWNEPVSEWTDVYVKEYGDCLASYTNKQQSKFQMFGVCNALNRKEYSSLSFSYGYMPKLPLSLLPLVRMGDCEVFAKHSVAQFRAMGIPAALDYMPQWGNRSMGHAWPVFLPTEDTFFPFGVNERIGDYLFQRPDDRVPKVFRFTFSKQPEMFAIYESNEDKPEFFQTPCMKDVTDSYVETSDVNVSLFPDVKSEFVYLAVFDNQDWRIVHYAEREGGKALFRKMGHGIVYLPVVYGRNGSLLPAAYPFVLELDGSVRTLQANEAKKETVRLERKYRNNPVLAEYCKELRGGKFQVANNKDFSDSITIAMIGESVECRFNELPSSNLKQFHFFRYLAAPNSNYNMAEVEVYDEKNNRILTGKPFDNTWANTARKLYDSDVLTYYASYTANDEPIWAALEFEKPESVSKIRFLPRNDDNFIREGEVYQLYYWNGLVWDLVEETKGTYEGVLCIDNVPTNALLLLHNATRGVEERIFTFENGKQVWW